MERDDEIELEDASPIEAILECVDEQEEIYKVLCEDGEIVFVQWCPALECYVDVDEEEVL